jgi:nitroreductase
LVLGNSCFRHLNLETVSNLTIQSHHISRLTHMRTASLHAALFTLLFCLCPAAFLSAQEPRPIVLPSVQLSLGQPLMQALQHRRTTRQFRPDKLSPQVLANLLWAGFGINRAESGQRTAPSAMNSQEIDIYVALPEGLYVYAPSRSQLRPVLGEDLRDKTGGQDFARQAPLTLVYVADLSRLAKAKPEMKAVYANFDAGCISQNVYLYCASEGLGTVVHDLDRGPLAKAMKLGAEQQVIFAQAVGYPAEERSNGDVRRNAPGGPN